MPVHDANVYYKVPGHLPAENYASPNKMQIWPTNDVDGFAHMASTEAGAWLDLNIQVNKAGKYKLRFRVTGASGDISIFRGGQLLGKVGSTSAEGQCITVETSVPLAAGAQTLRVRCENSGMGINWLEFAPL